MFLFMGRTSQTFKNSVMNTLENIIVIPTFIFIYNKRRALIDI